MGEILLTANVFDVLKERGFLAQCTNEDEVQKLLGEKKVTFYIGFDPTADSLHAGHFIALMAMSWMQKFGHRPICLVGGGTGTVGDPSGRSDLRKVMTDDIIEHNCNCFKKQMARFIDFTDNKALLINNGDWLRKLGYIDLLREVGAHFTVNRMLAAECYKQRWEKGLTFLEFNYMVMQAYDFYKLNADYDCVLQMGGDDQWSNIIAGVELTRRKSGKAVYGLTNKLLTKSDGSKMGKTAGGALWLDADKVSPYDFYQYWRNVDDADVKTCLSLLTFLPMEEVNRLSELKDEAINEAKQTLAYEVTKLVHGQDAADEAKNKAQNLFSGSTEDLPPIRIGDAAGQRLVDILVNSNIIESKSEGRRLIKGNGLSINGRKISDPDYRISAYDLERGIVIKIGKKKFYKFIK
ncbi:MAG: tyrosine--tRNA ligase [Selenomonadaceae bacterium]|nr:tyrosine--tRNA ligase [Selenomonadaceae bacterium]MBR1858523.1 tyrosine--tRNA ligase [Selenomonadaceae bacterium]